MKGSKVIGWIVGIGIGLRVLLWVFQVAPEGDDGLRYLSESVNMVRHGVFSTASFVDVQGVPLPSAHDMPLWPSIMACIYWLTDSIRITQYIAGALNIAMCLGAAVLIISLLRNKPFAFTDEQVGVAVGVYLLMPESVMYSLCHMPDQLAVSSVVLALWCYFRGVYLNHKYLIATVLAFVVAIYAKPICIPLAIALLLALMLLLRCAVWKRAVVVAAALICVVACLYPWTIRNKMAFGTAGLTSISGTNLYSCNWGRLAASLPMPEREIELEEMKQFEASIANDDLMLQSQKKGEYARKKILLHLPEYLAYTVKMHPRLYVGTGTVAMFRYLGLDRECDYLDGLWGSGKARGYTVNPQKSYSMIEKAVGIGLQVFSWVILMVGYCLVMAGMIRGLIIIYKQKESRYAKLLVFLCPMFSLVLLAAVIGPITSTRYRFIMIPFFAIVAGYSLLKHSTVCKSRTEG